ANNNFEGWFLDEALTQPVTDISSVQSTAHTLYAKWKTLSMVTVTFNTDGGTAIESKEYQADGLTYATAPNTGLPTPTHTNSNFEGWFLDAALTQPVTETGTVLSVAHTLYAKWSSNSTPIRIPQLAAHSVNATAIGKNIVLQNLPQNAKVQVYSLNGKQIYSANPENLKILEIGVQTGVYIVKVNKQILQVAVNNRIR
ncbi:MAG: InlB B-repeat-containing protein, partial [Fibromonadales bacterium]|nr:InlB B-repeat-containing protein [Fibromonadales bacterium]